MPSTRTTPAMPQSPASTLKVRTPTSTSPTSTITVTPNLITKSRTAAYDDVLPEPHDHHKGAGFLHTVFWLAALSFFATPAGLVSLLNMLNFCTNDSTLDYIITSPLKTFLTCTTITAVMSIVTFIPFAMLFDYWYDTKPELRNQQDKKYDVYGKSLFQRLEVQLTCINLTTAAMLTSTVVVLHAFYPTLDKLYFTNPFTSPASTLYFFFTSACYFFYIDIWAYLAHRSYHTPFLYKHIHKLHHSWKQTTAFTSLALHPFEFFSLTLVTYLALFIIPMHPAAVFVNLIFIHINNVIDHSGLYFESSLPFTPCTLFHDDHHRMFHVNYGQSLTVWDKLGGTIWGDKKGYGEKNFSY